MLNAQYPGMVQEYITLEYILKGMQMEPNFQYVIKDWAARPTSTIIEPRSMEKSIEKNVTTMNPPFQTFLQPQNPTTAPNMNTPNTYTKEKTT